jgi:hypothetical protein
VPAPLIRPCQFSGQPATLNEEAVQPRDLQMMGMLRPLGIEKGKEFKPDAKTVAVLKQAAAEARAWLMEKVTTEFTPWWSESQWVVPTPPITVPTAFTWETPDYFGVDARAIALYQYFCPTAKLGTGSFYFGSFYDHTGKPLEGGSNYRLHVPAKVPVTEFWSITPTRRIRSGCRARAASGHAAALPSSVMNARRWCPEVSTLRRFAHHDLARLIR